MKIYQISSYLHTELLLNKKVHANSKSSQQECLERDRYIPSRNTEVDVYPTYSGTNHLKAKGKKYEFFEEPIQMTSKDRHEIEHYANIITQKMIEQNDFNAGLKDINGIMKQWNEPDKKNYVKAVMIYLEAINKARVPLKAKEIGQLLEENNIQVNEEEEFRIFIDKTGIITVTGENEEKSKAIETILNNKQSLADSLHYLTFHYSQRYKGVENAKDSYHEMEMESYLRRKTNGAISLADLSIKNGKIIGLPDELDELIHLTKPNMTQDEKYRYEAIQKVLAKVLTIGIDNIPDFTTEMVYKNGLLIIY